MDIENIVVLTGAGISAESGLATFRGSDGLWCGQRVEDVATPEAFARDPALVQDFYNTRRRQLKEVVPNAAHRALARLAERWPGKFTLVTQNVDDLHDRALAEVAPSERFRFIHMHGELKKSRCVKTGRIEDTEGDLTVAGTLRPHIVWFGEMPIDMERIQYALEECHLFVSIGTSGNVYPAAGFVQLAKQARALTVEINLEPSVGNAYFDECYHGPAGTLVPRFVDGLLATHG